MNTPAERIRRARTYAAISQVALADAAGVKRSAVAQWERRNGSHPSMHHLVAIAVATGVHLEWLGTGRGSMKLDVDAWSTGLRSEDFAQDDIEAGCLRELRRLPLLLRKQVMGILTLLAKNF